MLAQALVWWDSAVDYVKSRLEDRDQAMVADYQKHHQSLQFDLVPG